VGNKNHSELNQRQVSNGYQNSASAMIGRMIDDKFGGRSVGKCGSSSISAIQSQVDSLEMLLKEKK
jgi:hypothetical protein